VANLNICRVKQSDTGWYSCYIVKNTKTDHDLKFYTYLSVLNNESPDDSDDDYVYSNADGYGHRYGYGNGYGVWLWVWVWLGRGLWVWVWLGL
jgi:hypothetical protein